MTGTPTSPSQGSQALEAVRAIEAAWNAAGRTWDAQALAAIYAADAVFHGGRPDHHVGHAAIRAYFDSYVGVIESATLALRDQHIQTLAAGVVLAQGFGDFGFVLQGGQATRSLVRTTLVLVQQDVWRVQAHHFSPPPPAPPLGQDA